MGRGMQLKEKLQFYFYKEFSEEEPNRILCTRANKKDLH